ncbi:hypothetical protein Tco_1075529 [Tanacetum coccineum]
MNPQKTQQVIAHDEKWVPSAERVKISPTTMRLETIVHQKEEKFQVIIDVIKNSTCFKAFTISADKCLVDAEVFRNILDICPRVKGEEFIELQDDDATLTFLINLGYKGPLHKHTSMYVDHMYQPWRTLAAIINKCLFGKTASNDRLRKSIIDILILSDVSICQIPPKKSRGKGSQGKKTADTPVADVKVSEESDSEPSTKRTASRRVIKKKVTISAVNKIIPDLDVALELGKSISLTEAVKEETTRQVHATHPRIVTDSVPEPARRRPSCISFRDTSRVSKKVSSDPSQKVKGVQSLTLEKQEAAYTMQALKESKKTNRRTRGSSEGTEDQSDDEEVDWIYSDENNEKKDDDDDKIIDIEMTDDEETKYKFVHGDEQVNDDEDEEMSNVEVEDSRKGDAEISDVAKADAKKIKEIKDDAKKSKLPPTNSSFSISSSFGDQFLKLSYDTSLVSTIKDTTDAKINSLLNIKIQYEVPHIQSPYVLIVLVLVIFEPSVLTPIPETPSVALATTLLTPSSVSTTPHVPYQTTVPIPTPPIITDAPTITIVVTETNALTDVQLRVGKLEKDVSELKKIDYSAETLASLKSQVPTVVDSYLGSKFGDVLQKELQKHTTDFIQKHYVKQTPESSKIQKPTIDLEQESEKSA